MKMAVRKLGSGSRRVGKARRIRENESLIRELSAILVANGTTVRREQLKQGPGWRATSGLCTVEGYPCLFIDSRLPESEQLALLVTSLRPYRQNMNVDELSDDARSLLLAEPSAATDEIPAAPPE